MRNDGAEEAFAPYSRDGHHDVFHVFEGLFKIRRHFVYLDVVPLAPCIDQGDSLFLKGDLDVLFEIRQFAHIVATGGVIWPLPWFTAIMAAIWTGLIPNLVNKGNKRGAASSIELIIHYHAH